MGTDAAKEFLEKMKSDTEFAKSFLSCNNAEEMEDKLKREGLNCSLDEVKAIYSELTEDELKDIAGGSGHPGENLPRFW